MRREAEEYDAAALDFDGGNDAAELSSMLESHARRVCSMLALEQRGSGSSDAAWSPDLLRSYAEVRPVYRYDISCTPFSQFDSLPSHILLFCFVSFFRSTLDKPASC